MACLICSSAWGRGASPYLPLNLSPEIEHQIERVLILADKPVMTRPIAAAVVLDALPAACKVDQVLCTRVRKFLQRYTRKAAIDHAAFGFVGTEGATTKLANQRGQTSDSSYHASVHAYAQLNDYAIVSVGAFAYDDEVSPTGSMLSLGFDFAQLDVGFRDHWFSPFTGSSMLIGTQAETLPSVTLSNYRPLTRLGFKYELFLGELSNSDRILFMDEDGLTSGKPRVAGLHLGIEPAAGWSLAFNRLLQFGGGQRGGRGLSDFFRAFADPSKSDNVANAATQEQFGNQVASITSQFIFPGRVPFAAYIEYAGEDTSFEGNYRLGNAALSLGLHFPELWPGVDLTIEASDWQNGWYVSNVYGDGLTNEGNVLGHFGGDHRLFNDDVAAQSQFIRLGWEPRFGGVFDFTARTVRNDNSRQNRPLDPRDPLGVRTIRYERAYDVGIAYSRPLRGFSVGAEFLVGQDAFGDSFSRIGGYMRFTDEFGLGGASRRGFTETPRRQRGAELFFDAGVNLSSVNKRLDGNVLREKTSQEVAPHVAIGARRQISERGDLGVRLEFDRIDDAMLLAARLVDYRYRFRGPLALGAFFGAARYDLATPAYGYYIGAGVQWRNLLPNTDVNLDFRYGDKLARDKLLASDPPSTQRPDAFFDISGLTFGLSYRW